jgi:hypothetical protein
MAKPSVTVDDIALLSFRALAHGKVIITAATHSDRATRRSGHPDQHSLPKSAGGEYGT